MRSAVLTWVPVVVLLAAAIGCREPPLNQPPPNLLGAPSEPAPPRAARFAAGEEMGWGVRWRGMRIGNLELRVSRDNVGLVVASKLRPNRLARRLGRLRVELTSAFDRRGTVRRAHEQAGLGSRARPVKVAFDGTGATWQRGHRRGTHKSREPLHSVISALGVIRQAEAGTAMRRLLVVRGPDLYEVRFAVASHEPLGDKAAIRIDAEVRDRGGAGSLDAEISMWLSDDDKRSPLRVDVATPKARVIAELAYHSLPPVASR